MQFLESIRFENGHYHLLAYHQQRVDRTFAAFFPRQEPLKLESILPAFSEVGKFKFRVVYDQQTHHVEHALYQPKEIKSVQLVEANDLDYSFKFCYRSELNKLVQESEGDEIIIIKNGLITDTSYANIACFDGRDWWTPEQPLLKGTRRQDLINRMVLVEKRIDLTELSKFSKVCLINAMLDLEELTIDTQQLTF